MKNKLEIVLRLLKDNQISIEEATALLEGPSYPSYSQIYPPMVDWTYRPGPITYCGTTSTGTTSTNTATIPDIKVTNATVSNDPNVILYGGC